MLRKRPLSRVRKPKGPKRRQFLMDKTKTRSMRIRLYLTRPSRTKHLRTTNRYQVRK